MKPPQDALEHGGVQKLEQQWAPRGLIHRQTHVSCYPTLSDYWTEIIGDPIILEAVSDRLEHAAPKNTITGESHREVKAR